MRSLGLDSGKRAGYAVLDFDDRQRPSVVAKGELRHGDPLAHFAEILAEYRPDLVGVELPKKIYKRKGFGQDMAMNVNAASNQAVRFSERAHARGYRTFEMPAELCRREIAGKPNASNVMIKLALRLRVPTWPKVSNEHERDAGMAALLAGLDALLPAPLRKLKEVA